MSEARTKGGKVGISLALFAAILYALNSPFSKLLLIDIPPTLMAGLLYIGAAAGMSAVALSRKVTHSEKTEKRLTKRELPYTAAMILLDIAAPVFLLIGLDHTTAAGASLLNNFEIVATAFFALVMFGEKIGLRLWLGISFVTASCVLLSFEGADGLEFSAGSLFIIAACVCWGLENNCTRMISNKDPMQIVLLKGGFSGTASLIIGLIAGETVTDALSVFAALGTGFLAYGLSIYFYVYAQRFLGAARTSAYYAVAPFVGALLSLMIFGRPLFYTFYIALGLMIIGAYLSSGVGPHFLRHKNKDRLSD